ncbi:MAG: hypothetical protein M3Z09_10720 [Acidobacteriota bacterium]|nr:hypothetical protein [Acidobacteriota bacterium]
MIEALLFLLVADVTILRDGVITVPPGQWRYDEFSVGERLPADVDCTFRVEAPAKARVELVTKENLRLLMKGEDYENIAASASGALHQEIGVPGGFAIVVVNQDENHPAHVAMRLSLDTSGRSLVKVRYLSPERKLIVILASFVGFLLIVTLSARTLLVAMKRHE